MTVENLGPALSTNPYLISRVQKCMQLKEWLASWVFPNPASLTGQALNYEAPHPYAPLTSQASQAAAFIVPPPICPSHQPGRRLHRSPTHMPLSPARLLPSSFPHPGVRES